ncbi:MAG: TetR/AcrR family transcriptional regulator [Pseudomonadota bacterium]
MNLLAHPPKPDRQPRLGAADWIEVALQSLVSGGIEAVQITALARTLKVTRGSFYWHFETRDDLLAALIQEWRARNTDVIVEAISDVPTLDEGILELFAVWVDHTRFDPALDGAIRAWAKHDLKLSEVLKAEDTARIDAIASFFERHGYEVKEAFIRARVIYLTQISFYALGIDEDASVAQRLSYLEAYFRSFTGRDIDPDICATYRARVLGEDQL